MKVRTNRVYPYPVLFTSSRDYKNAVFETKIELEYDAEFATITLNIYISDEMIKEYISNNRVGVFCYVDCSETKFREVHELQFAALDEHKIKIKSSNLNGNVEIICTLVTKEDIYCQNDNFDGFYEGENVHFTKNSIIGYGDTEMFYIDKKLNIDGEIPSIFLITEKIDNKEVTYDASGERIIIYLPSKEYSIYLDSTGQYKRLKQMFINVSVLIDVLDRVKDGTYDFIDNPWSIVLESKLQSLGYEGYSDDKFKNEQSIVLAQKLFGDISLDAFKEFEKLRIGSMEE